MSDLHVEQDEGTTITTVVPVTAPPTDLSNTPPPQEDTPVAAAEAEGEELVRMGTGGAGEVGAAAEIHATCTELARLGVHVEEHQDGMTILPCSTFKPANIQTYSDHRMAMAFSLIGLGFDGVTIENPACVSKTFPSFFDVLETLR